jgi:predicted metalloprotease with PDZ domain
MVVPYPGEVGPENWSAETRGNVVVLLLGRKASRKRVLTQLGIVCSHELFHLWVPNGLELKGDYDWFFEGFTLYRALRTDLRLGLISFNDYLDTIARVYDSYRAAPDRDRLSLIRSIRTSLDNFFSAGIRQGNAGGIYLRFGSQKTHQLSGISG